MRGTGSACAWSAWDAQFAITAPDLQPWPSGLPITAAQNSRWATRSIASNTNNAHPHLRYCVPTSLPCRFSVVGSTFCSRCTQKGWLDQKLNTPLLPEGDGTHTARSSKPRGTAQAARRLFAQNAIPPHVLVTPTASTSPHPSPGRTRPGSAQRCTLRGCSTSAQQGHTGERKALVGCAAAGMSSHGFHVPVPCLRMLLYHVFACCGMARSTPGHGDLLLYVPCAATFMPFHSCPSQVTPHLHCLGVPRAAAAHLLVCRVGHLHVKQQQDSHSLQWRA